MYSIRRPILASLAGLLTGLGLMGQAGTLGGQAMFGAAAGCLLGAAVGLGAALGKVHRITVGAVLYALIFCVLGPGVDDYGGNAAVFGAFLGAFVGWLGWRF